MDNETERMGEIKVNKITFNPNNIDKKQYLWATYLPYRTPAFKLHEKEQFAKSAFTNHAYGIIYIWNSDTSLWDEVFRLEDPDDLENCGHGPTKRNWQNKLVWEYRWVGKGRDSKYIRVCGNCKRIPMRASNW